MNIEPLFSKEGKPYVKIEEMIVIIKGLIDSGKLDNVDTSLMELLFVWLAEKNDELILMFDKKRAEEMAEKNKKLNEYMKKYEKYKEQEQK